MSSASPQIAHSAPPAPRLSSTRNRVVIAILSLLLVVGIARAVQLAWMTDDAFISIRYAENLVNSHGLVYNAGERVEGYTNLLWTLLLAAGLWLGAPPIPTAQWLGILAYLALASCLAHWSWRRHRDLHRPFLPLAAGVVLVSQDFQEWATGGLETMLFTVLALQGLLLTRVPAATRRLCLAAGLLFALLVLTRPDGLLFAAAGVLSCGLPAAGTPRRTRMAHALSALAPVAVALAVLIPFKLVYYGELLPTAFYSKSVLHPYYSQGLVYLELYLTKNWFLPVALGGVLIARWRARREGASRADCDDLFFLAAGGLFIAYIVHVGGDFMFARRLLPAVPLLLLVVEDQLGRLRDARVQAALAAACLVAAAASVPLFSDERPRIRGVADERRFYNSRVMALRRHQAELVGGALADTDVRVMFEGGMCVFGYYSRLPYLVEMTGLTQYSLAKLPLEQRGNIGHEKAPTEEWLTENRIHLIVSQQYPPISRPPVPQSLNEVYFGDVAMARIHLYSDAVMDRLRRIPQVSFVPIERVIGQARRQIERAEPEEAEQVYQRLHRYYFRTAGERGQQTARALRALIDQKRRAPLLPGGTSPDRSGGSPSPDRAR
jgi:hypothetical protein